MKKRNHVTYDNPFERIFLQFMIESQRVTKEKKIQKFLIKKKATQTRKINVVIKRQMMTDNKIKRTAARAIKKKKKKEN